MCEDDAGSATASGEARRGQGTRRDKRDLDDIHRALLAEAIERWRDEQRAAAYNVVQDWDLADSVLAEVAISINSLEKPPALHPADLQGARRYVMRAVTNTARNRRRDDSSRRAREQPLDPQGLPPSSPAPSPEDIFVDIESRHRKRQRRHLLRQSLHVLTPRQREAIQLELDGLDREAIATRLKVTLNAVDKLRQRARERLRKRLADHPDIP